MTTASEVPMEPRVLRDEGATYWLEGGLDEAEIATYKGAFIEASAMIESPMKQLAGPHYESLVSIHQAAADDLQGIDPRLTPEVFASGGYQSSGYGTFLRNLPLEIRIAISEVGQKRAGNLRRFAEDTVPEDIDLPPGLLEAPKFLKQGEDPVTADLGIAMRGCFNACYRMAISGITEEKPRESSVAIGLLEAVGTTLPDDRIYMDSLRTNAFKDMYGDISVSTICLTGASLPGVASIAEVLKRKRAERKVIAIVSLLSEGGFWAGNNIWHANMLLSARNEAVVVHDPILRPKPGVSGEKRHRDVFDFHERWAFALNRVHFVVADPK